MYMELRDVLRRVMFNLHTQQHPDLAGLSTFSALFLSLLILPLPLRSIRYMKKLHRMVIRHEVDGSHLSPLR